MQREEQTLWHFVLFVVNFLSSCLSSWRLGRPTTAVTSFALLLLSLFTAQAAVPCREVLTFADGNVPDREIFVSPTGNDSTGAGTESRPYRTPGRAIQVATPGTAIRLLGGTYSGGIHLSDIKGTDEAPIWLGGVPGRPRPIISGGTTALQLSRVRHLIVEHLEVTGSTANGVNCDDGGAYADPDATRYVLFRHLDIHDIGTGGNNDCLKLSGLDDYWVLDSTFRNGSAGGSGIDHVGCHWGVIARCQFQAMGSNAIQCKGGSSDIVIKWCQFIDGGSRAINLGGSTGFEFFRPPLSTTEPNVEAQRIQVTANIFKGSDAPVAYVGCVTSLVAHNTIVNPTRWIARILQETTSRDGYEFLPCSQSRFANNLVFFRRGDLSTFVNVGVNTEPGSFTFANNLWFAHDNPSQSTPSLPVSEANPVIGRDPQFNEPANGDFSLAPTSPAIGQGMPLTEVAADFQQQCFARPPSIGAFEAEPTTVTHSDADAAPDWWEAYYGFDRLNEADGRQDPDADQAMNEAEYLAATDPTDGRSVLRVLKTGVENNAIWMRFPTTTRRIYTAEASPTVNGGWVEADTGSSPGDGTIQEVRTDISPLPGERLLRLRCEFP